MSFEKLLTAALALAMACEGAFSQVGTIVAGTVHGQQDPSQLAINAFSGAGGIQVNQNAAGSWQLSIPGVGSLPVVFVPTLPNDNPGVYSTVTGEMYISVSAFGVPPDIDLQVKLFAVAFHEYYHHKHWVYRDEYKTSACGGLTGSSLIACEQAVDDLWDCHGPLGKGKGACFELSANSATFAKLCAELKMEGLSQKVKDALGKARDRACGKARNANNSCSKATSACGGGLPQPSGTPPLPPANCMCP